MMSVSTQSNLRQLGTSELMVSNLGWGMWRFAGTELSAAQAIVETVFAAGINFFDTADIYGYTPTGGFGDAELLLGEVFKQAPHLRDNMVLATKAGITPPTPYNSTTAYLVEACHASLKRMNTDHIDLWQIHRPDLLAHPSEIAKAVDMLMAAGKIRAFGVSNYTISQTRALQAFLNVPIVSFQPEFSPVAIEPISDGTLDLAIETGAAVLAWSPLGGGRLADPDGDDRLLRIVSVLDRIAEEQGVARASVAYAWVMAHPSKPMPLVGTQNSARIAETAEVAKISLSRDQWYEILVASRGVRMP